MTPGPTLSHRCVVIHEDDVAMTHGANTAFAELSALGSCSAGSVMVPCPWFPEAAEMASTNNIISVVLGQHRSTQRIDRVSVRRVLHA